MTALMRILDAHVHFWDPDRLHYPWLSDAPELQRAFVPHDMPALADGTLDGVIFVEANCLATENLGELDFIDTLIDGGAPILGTVAFVDMCDAARRSTVLQELARRPRVVGVRHNIQRQPTGFGIQAEFVRGVQEVNRMGLSFDLCITADQLREATELVRQCSDTAFVLDHCGKPGIAGGALEPWATDLRRLAEHDNVACKLSGLLSEARPDQRTAAGLLPFASHALECFGPDRLMYGSDWPVVNMAGGEPLWRSLALEATSNWPDAARQAFFFDNAVRFYGIRYDAPT
ncbi:amidohydrolase family protein [soil metagenome]